VDTSHVFAYESRLAPQAAGLVLISRRKTGSGHMDRIETIEMPPAWHGRSYRRFRLEFPVRLKVETTSQTIEIDAVSTNLSVGGLLVRSALHIPETTLVTFVLSVHGSQSVRPIRLMGEGRIVRVESGEVEGTFLMAVKCDTPVTQLEEYPPM
jgi:hypothetical protein